MIAAETYKFKDGRQLEIHSDDDAESPRSDDNLGTMVCFHKSYCLGDTGHGYDQDDYQSWWGLQNAITADNPDCIILPMFMYEHSGLRVKVGSFQGHLPQGHAEFDSGQIGYIFICRDKIEHEFGDHGGRTDEQIEGYLRGEVETYDQHLRGDRWGFIMREPPCERCDQPGLDGDSCWGFYGSNPIENGMIDHLDEKHRKELAALVN